MYIQYTPSSKRNLYSKITGKSDAIYFFHVSFLLPLNGASCFLRLPKQCHDEDCRRAAYAIRRCFVDMITAENITKSFGNLQVLNGISLEIGKGEVVSIVGASGAGKSTLLQILGTLSRPDGGSLAIDGYDVLSMKGDSLSEFRNRKIGFVFQSHHLLPEFTALENVMIPAFIAGTGRKEAQARARELLAEVGLEGRLDHKPSELSGGEAQRVAIARALVNGPAVLFADEPSGNLDSVTKQEIHRLFFDMRERHGQTVVIVTHDSALADMCDRKFTMQDGLILKVE
mgnify:FL=1